MNPATHPQIAGKSPQKTGPTGRNHYPALDGLRGVAILLVLFVHNYGFMNYFFFGWVGVDLFFVLSGFLITEILLDTMNQPGFLKKFYIRRFLRIFPLYYLLLVVCLFLLPAISSLHLDIRFYDQNQVWQWAYLQNWLYVFKVPYGDKLLMHTWSLAVEEQFYLVWPLLILLFRSPRKLMVLMLLIFIGVGIARYLVWNQQVEDLAYNSLYTFTRIDGLCIGSMIAILQKLQPGWLKKYSTLLVFLMALVNFGFYFMNIRSGFTLPYLAFVGYSTFAVLFGLVVYECVNEGKHWLKWMLDNRILKFFGKISYGLYVWHWPLYLLLFEPLLFWIVKEFHLSIKWAATGSATLALIAALVMSLLSYRFFEKPFLSLKNRFNS